MTLASSGKLSFSDIETEVGKTVGSQLDMTWVRSNSKLAIGGATGVIKDMNSLHNLAWYLNNTQGNCSNGNCSTASSSGNIQCQNCSLTALSNCVNCDSASYLQPNCNCACTYNCSQVADQSYNCNCDCPLVCACACSDERLKLDVTNIRDALQMVGQLQCVYYKWNQAAGSY